MVTQFPSFPIYNKVFAGEGMKGAIGGIPLTEAISSSEMYKCKPRSMLSGDVAE